ncbi:NUDIX hydrolase [Olivibacter sp. XZL3]|uniref:NUDIX hydrolase n=1 Tax=Olivibacter sp. XZL3 TaxID=1735116 RepID=UPI0019822E1E|nr:NUDIX domain-containing protein [Olivibacter sp. XZL3]
MNESVLLLTDFKPDAFGSFQQIDSQTFDFVKLFKKSSTLQVPTTFLLLVEDPRATLRTLKKSIKLIGAAGGLVKNGDGDILFIHRLGKWDLPKGKIDPGEKSKKAALREVEEECGIHVDYLGPKIMSSYHAYEMKGNVVLKKTNWYEMGVNKKPKLIPQTSEDITEARWIQPEQIGEVLTNTYGIIKDVLEKKAYI